MELVLVKTDSEQLLIHQGATVDLMLEAGTGDFEILAEFEVEDGKIDSPIHWELMPLFIEIEPPKSVVHRTEPGQAKMCRECGELLGETHAATCSLRGHCVIGVQEEDCLEEGLPF